MAYIISIPKEGGVIVRSAMRAWYHGLTKQGLVSLTMSTSLDIAINSKAAPPAPALDTDIQAGNRKLLLVPEEEVVLHCDGIDMVRFTVDPQPDGYLRFVFFQTEDVNGKRLFTKAIPPAKVA